MTDSADAYAMTAAQPGGADMLTRTPLELPVPGPGEVRVRHTAIGVNFIDIYIRTGLYPWPVERDLILGSEAAGVVDAVGEDVTTFAPGERVAYTIPNGAYATHRVVSAAHLVHLPEVIADEVAAGAMLKGLTAYYLLHDSYKVQPGDTVLFHAAAGGVGLIAGQWLRALGVRAIGTAGGPEKCEMARANGYDQVIDYTREDFTSRVRELTQDKGVAAVYDSVGADTIMGSLDCLATFGTLVSFGQSSGAPDAVRISHLARGSLRLTRPTLFHFTADRAWLVRASAALFDAIRAGEVRVPVGARRPLSEAGEAHEALAARATTGSTVLVP